MLEADVKLSLIARTTRRMAVTSTQKPFATILSCVDSRVPIELIFDRGIGDLVVIRSAGEVLDRSVVGSLEFGVAELNTPLLMVLGSRIALLHDVSGRRRNGVNTR